MKNIKRNNDEDSNNNSIKAMRLNKGIQKEIRYTRYTNIINEKNDNAQNFNFYLYSNNTNNHPTLYTDNFIFQKGNIKITTDEARKTNFTLKNNLDFKNTEFAKDSLSKKNEKYNIQNKGLDERHYNFKSTINPNLKNYKKKNNEINHIFPNPNEFNKEERKINNNQKDDPRHDSSKCQNSITSDFRRYRHENKDVYSFPKILNQKSKNETKINELLGKKTKSKIDEIENNKRLKLNKKGKSIANFNTKTQIGNVKNSYKKRNNFDYLLKKKEIDKIDSENKNKNQNNKYIKRSIISNKQISKNIICNEINQKDQKIKQLNLLIQKPNITENDIEEIIQFIIDEKKDNKKLINEMLVIDKLDKITLKNNKKIVLGISKLDKITLKNEKEIIVKITANESFSLFNNINNFEQKDTFIKNNKLLEKNEIKQKNIQDNKISKKKNIIKINNMNYQQNFLTENQNKNSEDIENILKNGNDEIDNQKNFNNYLKYTDEINEVKDENNQKLLNDIVEDKEKKKEKDNFKKLKADDDTKFEYIKNNNKELKVEKLKENTNNHEYDKIYCFRNIGNNCYLNSSLQLLTRIKDLKNEVFNFKGPRKGSTEGKLIDEFKKLLKEIEETKDNNLKLNPSDLKRVMGILDERYLENHQEDSNEFISNFIDGLLWETGNTDKVYKKLEIKNEEDKKPYESLYSKFYLRRGDSFLLDLFYGILKIEKKCKNCNYSLIKFNAYNMLELPIYDLVREKNNKSLTLKEILDAYISEKKNEKSCNKCQANEIFTKNSIYTLPKYLIISFGRSVGEKYVYNNIKYPEDMNLKSQFYNNNYNYKLECVIVHSGSSNNGHYTALCPIYKGRKIWYEFSDNSYFNSDSVFHSENSIILLYKSII